MNESPFFWFYIVFLLSGKIRVKYLCSSSH